MVFVVLILSVVFGSLVLAHDLSLSEFHRDNLEPLLSLERSVKDNLLLPFNGTRVPGSQESTEIQDFIKDYFSEKLRNEWSLESDSFEENNHNFTNLVFTPLHGDTYLVLAAHYDTKLEPKGFVGAIDSGASCAILLYIAKFIDQVLTTDRNLLDPLLLNNNVGLKIIFFDGEEAFDYWSADDSIYGARHLAKKWQSQGLLERIELFVLLDLLGGQESLPVCSYHGSSHVYYKMLSDIEDQVAPEGDQWLDPAEHRYVQTDPFLDDDHRPFYEAGIPVLHLIPFPFPSTWHTIDDDFDHLDETKIRRWAVMLSEFVVRFVQDLSI